MTKLLLIAITSVLLTACASVNNKLVTEKALQNKAASAIGANPYNIIVTNKNVNDESVTFNASIKDKTYLCSYHATLIKQTKTLCKLQ